MYNMYYVYTFLDLFLFSIAFIYIYIYNYISVIQSQCVSFFVNFNEVMVLNSLFETSVEVVQLLRST